MQALRSPTQSSIFSLVLAAGEGSRLKTLTTDSFGNYLPKQFCSLHGGASLLRYTLERALHITPMARTVAVVANEHRRYWQREINGMFERNIVVQPENKGTALGILLPLLHILRADPDAIVVTLPSDHFVNDEHRLHNAIKQAIDNNTGNPRNGLTLIGIEPEWADPALGYIVPGPMGANGTRTIASFVEKPELPQCKQLLREGALWNSFILVAKALTFVDLISHRHYNLVRDLRTALNESHFGAATESRALERFYQAQLPVDFSRDILQGLEQHLTVVRAAPCGWADLGTHARVAACLRTYPTPKSIGLPYAAAAVSLAERCARLDPQFFNSRSPRAADARGQPEPLAVA